MQAPLALDEFAAALAATDVIVSVDTMAAHCAGALGHPVLVMLTDAPAWYWGVGGDKCRWYPSARLFRRSAGADWAATVEAVAAGVMLVALRRRRGLHRLGHLGPWHSRHCHVRNRCFDLHQQV